MISDFQQFVIEARIAIWSMANDRKTTIDKIVSYKETIALHLSYVIAYPSSVEQKHWRKELWNLFDDVNRRVGLCKTRVPHDFLIHLLYEGYLGRPSDREIMFGWAHRHMNNRTPEVSKQDFVSTDFKALVEKLLKSPSSLWDEIN